MAKERIKLHPRGWEKEDEFEVVFSSYWGNCYYDREGFTFLFLKRKLRFGSKYLLYLKEKNVVLLGDCGKQTRNMFDNLCMLFAIYVDIDARIAGKEKYYSEVWARKDK